MLATVWTVLPRICFCSMPRFVFLALRDTFRFCSFVAKSFTFNYRGKLRSIQLRNCGKLRQFEFENLPVAFDFGS